jgi:hypothetical protein
MQYQGTNSRDIEADVNKVLDDAVEKLRWARQHLQERNVGAELRELEAKLGYLAQALTWENDGEAFKADIALNLAQGRSRREQDAMRQAWEDMWWSH